MCNTTNSGSQKKLRSHASIISIEFGGKNIVLFASVDFHFKLKEAVKEKEQKKSNIEFVLTFQDGRLNNIKHLNVEFELIKTCTLTFGYIGFTLAVTPSE